MYSVLRALLLTILAGMLLIGRCLPCRSLYANTTAKACCDNSTTCGKDHHPTSESVPCPFKNYMAASLNVDPPSAQKIHLDIELQISSSPLRIAAQPPLIPNVDPPPSCPYAPPPLYMLQERYLI